MKKIIFTLGIIIAVGGIIFGATNAYFADTEKSENNTAMAGTFDIDDEGTWTKSYSVSDIYPGKDPEEINFTLRNMGSLPMRVWMTIKNVSNEENGISDSEQDWYIANDVKNDVDSVMVYALNVDGNLALEQEAGITVEQIKDYYIGLVKLDIGISPPSYGILEPGETINIVQKFYLPPETQNWAQSDIMSFEIEILAQQVDVQEPIKQLSFIQNKYASDPKFKTDGIAGVLKYDSYAEEFNYDFIGRGLVSGRDYNLIYYPDPWATPKSVLVLSNIMTADGKGKIDNLGNSVDTDDLPRTTGDTNYPHGAKIWLVTSDKLSNPKVAGSTSDLTWSGISDWLLDNWPGLIRYTKSSDGNPSGTETVNFADLGADPQFGPLHDYSTANVSFVYDTPVLDKLSGTMTGLNMKPYATYQAKFIGKPICDDPSGSDIANEYIGYKGRWTCVDCACSGAGCNRNDAQYQANKVKLDTDPTKECIAGYLVWDYFTADNSGNITKTIETTNSYHVLWCSGGTCGQSNNSQIITTGDPNFHDFPTCEPSDVNGQIERFTCNGLVLDAGTYDLDFVLTEESFHQSTYGVWTTVMSGDINFEIE